MSEYMKPQRTEFEQACEALSETLRAAEVQFRTLGFHGTAASVELPCNRRLVWCRGSKGFQLFVEYAAGNTAVQHAAVCSAAVLDRVAAAAVLPALLDELKHQTRIELAAVEHARELVQNFIQENTKVQT